MTNPIDEIDQAFIVWGVIFAALLVVGIVARDREPIEQVVWTECERMMILFGKGC